MYGGCTCGRVRYRLSDAPMVVHCCHCRWCQRETGSAFAVNAVIERDRVELLAGEPELVMTPSASGKGQEIARCPDCRVALWSHYAGSGRLSSFIRCGTLDDPAAVPPDVHIYTGTKLPWVELPAGALAYREYYPDPAAVWRPEARARWRAMLGKPAL